MSKLVCPKCGNNRFLVTAHVTETWEVDEDAEFCDIIRTEEEQVVKRPDIESGDFMFACAECNTEAKVVP